MDKAKHIFNNKKVLIMGLGTKGGGVASAKFANKYGAEVTITDLQDEKYLKSSLGELSGISKKLVLGGHNIKDFENHDIIIKNPGIKYSNRFIQHALRSNKIIETPISLFTQLYNKPYIGITGTKGKSYTTALVSHLLSNLGIENIAVGNNCISPLDYLGAKKEFVFELSSWQLHEMGIQNTSPNIACWLNFFPDHMNYYSSINEYFNDKSKIFKNQNIIDYSIVPYKYTEIKDSLTEAKQIIYSLSDLSNFNLNTNQSTCYINNNLIIYKESKQSNVIAHLDKIEENFAEHQLELALASICISIAYLKKFSFPLDNEVFTKIRTGLDTFQGLEHRFETIYNENKIRIINDSAASTPESTILALKSVIKKPIVLIAGGGGHKNLDYSELIEQIISQRVIVVLYKNDETSAIITKGLQLANYPDYYLVDRLSKAVKHSFKLANSTGTILLSPACSGAPMFKDMLERGKLFKSKVRRILNSKTKYIFT